MVTDGDRVFPYFRIADMASARTLLAVPESMTNPYESSQDTQEAVPQGVSRRGFRFMISGALVALCGFMLLGLIIAPFGFPEKPWPHRLRAVFHFDADFVLPLALVMLVGAGIGALVAFFTKRHSKPFS